jgi:hypothetical protein
MTMRYLKILALLAISTTSFGQAPPASSPTASDVARMTPEQQRQQFRCEQTRAQIKEQLNRKVSGPSDRDNLASLRKNEGINCVPPWCHRRHQRHLCRQSILARRCVKTTRA